MATERLRYLIEAQWKGQNAVNAAKQGFRDVGESVDKTARGLQNWRSAIPAITGIGIAMGGAAIAGRKLYDALGEGAALEKARGQFDRLAESIGTTADSLQNSLKNATQGLMSDAELVQSASQIMRLGLADTQESVTDLVNVAGQLGWDMNQVILTLANNSTMRLDALGLSIDDVKAKAAAFEQQGYDMDKAFDLAVIAAGKEKIDLLGDAADTTAGKMQQFQVKVENAQDAFNEGLVRGFASALDSVGGSALDAAEDVDILAGSVGNLIGVMIGGAVQFGTDFSALVGQYQSLLSGENISTVLNPLTGNMMALSVPGSGRSSMSRPSRGRKSIPGGLTYDIGRNTYTSGYDPLSGNRINERARALEYEQGQLIRAREAGWNPLTGAIIENADATDRATGSYGGFVSAIDETQAAMQELAATSGDYFSMLRNAKEFNLFEEVFKIGDKAGWSAGSMASFGVAAGLFDQGRASELMNQTYLLQYAEQLIKQGVSPADLPGILQGVQQQLADGGTIAQEFFGALDEQTIEASMNIDPAIEAYNALLAHIELNPPVIVPIIKYEYDPTAQGIVEEERRTRILE